MTKYIVRKEFVDAGGTYYGAGLKTDLILVSSQMLRTLMASDFIEEDKRWRANGYSNYFRINSKASVISAPNGTSSGKSDELYKLGNYFKSQETAEQVAQAVRLFFDWLHDTEAEDFQSTVHYAKSITQFEMIANNARRAVLADDKTQ